MKIKTALGTASSVMWIGKGKSYIGKKRGFSTKKGTLNWEKEFLSQQARTVEMKFREFFELYKRDKKPRIRENTYRVCWWYAVVIVALITGSVSILGVVISSIVSKIVEYRQKNTKRYLYEKKEEPYSEFIEMVYKIQEKGKAKENINDEEMLDNIFSFSKKLTLWGSNKVIRKWLAFRKISQEQNDNTKNLFMLEEIIFEIRKDMGQKKSGLEKGDILAFFVNDIEDYLPKDKKK